MFGIPVKFLIYAGIALALVAAGWHYKATVEENTRLERQLKSANATVVAQDEIIKQNIEIQEREANAVDEIERAPASDDGPVAPVLLRTIERLQNNSQ